MIEDGEALSIGGESALKGLVDDAKELKKAVVDFNNIREWGASDPSVKGSDVMRLLERGSNAMAAVVRAATAAKSRIALERSVTKGK